MDASTAIAPAIEVVESKLFAGVVADEIVACINDAIHEQGRCSLVLVGGKTPSVIYRTLSKPPRVGEVEWPKVKMFWGDERWVPRTDHQSNYNMTVETLISCLPQPGPQIYPVDTSLSSPAEGARKYAELVNLALGNNSGAPPVFDLVLLGVGDDGHTASIFPHSALLNNPAAPVDAPSICAAVPGPGGEGWRLTFVPQVLFSARKILFIVRGENKALIMKRVLEGADDPSALPARLFKNSTSKITWFLDSAAAQQLNKR